MCNFTQVPPQTGPPRNVTRSSRLSLPRAPAAVPAGPRLCETSPVHLPVHGVSRTQPSIRGEAPPCPLLGLSATRHARRLAAAP